MLKMFQRATVKKNERALLLRNGSFDRVLHSGTYWLFAGTDQLRVETFALEQPAFTHGLTDYLMEAVNGLITLPEKAFVGNFAGDTEAVDWALLWLPEGGELLTESYVNLIPTMQGGTHVNGLRQGLLDAMREFCEFRNILPRGVKLSAEDIWDRCAYVL